MENIISRLKKGRILEKGDLWFWSESNEYFENLIQYEFLMSQPT